MPVTADRVLPHDYESEEAALGCLLLDRHWDMRAQAPYGQVAGILTPAMFFDERNRAVWEAIARIGKRGEGIDQVTVTSELADMKMLDKAGEAARLSHLIATVPSPLHVMWYVDRIKQAYLRRLAITRGVKLVEEGFEGKRNAQPLNQGLDI